MTARKRASSDRARKPAPREPSRESRRREGDAPTVVGAQLQSPLAGRVESDVDQEEGEEASDGEAHSDATGEASCDGTSDGTKET